MEHEAPAGAAHTARGTAWGSLMADYDESSRPIRCSERRRVRCGIERASTRADRSAGRIYPTTMRLLLVRRRRAYSTWGGSLLAHRPPPNFSAQRIARTKRRLTECRGYEEEWGGWHRTWIA